MRAGLLGGRADALGYVAVPKLQDLLDRLPSNVTQYALVQGPPRGVAYVTEAEPTWVAPDLTPVDDEALEPGKTALIIISAPAAVGKSMLAREIAHETGAVLWDLAAFQVGSNFLAGTLSNAHGFDATSDVANGMSRGDFLIVMDALDEAVVKAGIANLEAFAEDLATVLGTLKPARPAIVILARAETAELTDLILKERGLPVAHYSIAYFDQAQAEEFLDRKLDRRPEPSHRSHREPFIQARNLLFSKVFTVLGLETGAWEEPEARGFLGYAPVLEALAEYLDHGNYAVLANEIEASFRANAANDRPGIWRFLVVIVERVLDREQGKLQENLPDDLKTRIREAGKLDAIYTPDEQCRRLVARALNQRHPAPDLPAELREDYETALRQILGEHPFVGAAREDFANVVFRDYIFARALVLGPEDERDEVRAFVGGAAFRPSPLLARLMLEMTPRSNGTRQIQARDFPILYESMRAEDAAGRSIGLSITETDGTLIAQVSSPTAGHLDLAVSVTEGEALEIQRRLSNAQVALENVTVMLGRAGEPFTLGPNTSVRAPGLIVRAPDLQIETRPTPDGGVLLVTERFSSEAPEVKITHHGPGKLELAVPHELAYPWAQYSSTWSETVTDQELEIAPALVELAKLVTWFKSEGYGSLGMHAEPLDAAAAKGRVSQALLDYTLNRGLITKEGKLYHLHPERFGLSLQQVKTRIASEPVRRFLEEYVARPS